MKKKGILSVLFAVFLMLCMNLCVVQAAGSGKLYLYAEENKNGTVNLICKSEGIGDISNGKIRIRYEAEKLTLKKSEIGKALSKSVYQINDCVQGTKEEGEVVLAFSSSKSFDSDGEWICLTLSMKGNYSLTDLKCELSLEELAAQGQAILPTLEEMQYAIDKQPSKGKSDISKAEVAEIPNQTFNKKLLSPKVTVTLKGKTLTEGTDFSVSYQNNKKPGKATVTIQGTGNYEGSKTVYFYITPKAPKLKKGKALSSRKIQVRWKKVKNADGYQIQVAANKKFTKKVKNINIKKKTIVKKKVKVKKAKKYFVRIRSYKVIDGKKVYGVYSAAKRVRMKK